MDARGDQDPPVGVTVSLKEKKGANKMPKKEKVEPLLLEL